MSAEAREQLETAAVLGGFSGVGDMIQNTIRKMPSGEVSAALTGILTGLARRDNDDPDLVLQALGVFAVWGLEDTLRETS